MAEYVSFSSSRSNDDDEPLVKRPRFSSERNHDGLSACSDLEIQALRVTQELKTQEAVSSSDGEVFCGGDSGFTELTGDFDSCQNKRSLNQLSSSSSSCHIHGSSSSLLDSSSCSTSAVCLTPASSVTEDNSCSGSAARLNPSVEDNNCILINKEEEVEGEDSDEDASSDISSFSCLSGMSGAEWKPLSGPIKWIQQQISSGDFSPRQLLEQLLPDQEISSECDRMTLFRFLVSMLSQPPLRKRLPDVTSLTDVVDLISRSKKIIVLTGAGVSVSCGIPDFRSRDGIYARLSKEFPTLPDPQSMFDIHYFRKDPRPFFKFAKEIYPGQFEPSPSHKFIKLLESHGKLLRNYTQNIDTLEETAGIDRVINCHGSFATASCTRCKFQVKAQDIREDIFEQRIPLCPRCPPDSFEMAVMKPDIVFFGEGLSDEFHQAMSEDKDECDLLLVMGSSLKVRPVALIPSSIHPKVPQILINREPLDHMNFDVELLGDCDVIVEEIANRLGGNWSNICHSRQFLKEIPFSSLQTNESSEATPDRCSMDDSMSCSPSSSSMTDESTPPPDTSSSDNLSSSLRRKSLADGIPEDSYFFIPPSRYVFKGAEVYNPNDGFNDDEEDEEDDNDDDGEGSDEQDTSSSSLDTTDRQEPHEPSSTSGDKDQDSSVHKASLSSLINVSDLKWSHHHDSNIISGKEVEGNCLLLAEDESV